MKIVKRLAFLICGAVAILIGRVFSGLRQFHAEGAPSPLLLYAVFLVGIIAVGVALLPSAWFERLNPKKTELGRLTAFGFLWSFAALGYLLVVVFDMVPPSSFQPPPQLFFLFCPACGVTVTVDPSLLTVVVLLAPINALVYGAVGGVLGTAIRLLNTASA